ncbi:YdiK family protein [Salisediminibacterium beveridgei]|uniref:DUF4305 domain-containing protein n=1 Tax=Salisediminibacterium beveridgei TaxID=632773 RepID=A0A1D7QYL7_9BACI|nr:YdiK family protein [Salisediminibacterium beveridgei]AOM84103.1 hypothetical protein BBEV_2766 [Salisediminibacterium beveridgei]
MKERSAKFYGYLYFTFGVILVVFATQAMGQTEGWDFWTILLMIFAALDFLIAFKYFSMHKQAQKGKENN